MSRRRKLVFWSAGLALLACVAGLLVLRSSWFAQFVKKRTIATIERATGGHATLGAFGFDWMTLTATLNDLVLRGTEPASAPPLLRSASIRVVFPFSALLRRQIIVRSIQVNGAELYLLVRKDGTTNIPQIRNDLIDVSELLALRIGQFSIRQGVIRTELQQFPIEANGRQLALDLRYARRVGGYQIGTSCRDLVINSRFAKDLKAASTLQLELLPDQLRILNATFQSGGSHVQARGQLQHFRAPALDLSVVSELAAADLPPTPNFSFGPEGVLNFSGHAHYDTAHSLHLTGNVTGRQLTLRARSFTVPVSRVAAQVDVLPNGASARDLRLEFAQGSLTGSLGVSDWRDLDFSGKLQSVDVSKLAGLYLHGGFPWQGRAGGPLHVTANLGTKNSCRSEAQIAIAGSGLPDSVDGSLKLAYACGTYGPQIVADLSTGKTQLKAAGTVGQKIDLHLDTAEPQLLLRLLDRQPALEQRLGLNLASARVQFNGDVDGGLSAPRIEGDLRAGPFDAKGRRWDSLQGHVALGPEKVSVTGATLSWGGAVLSVTGTAELAGYSLTPFSLISGDAVFRKVPLSGSALQDLAGNLPVEDGYLSGKAHLSGTVEDPSGSGAVTLQNLTVSGHSLAAVQTAFILSGDTLRLMSGEVRLSSASASALSFNGTFRHTHGMWNRGTLQLQAEGNNLPVEDFLRTTRMPGIVSGRADVHVSTSVQLTGNSAQLESLDGKASFGDLAYSGIGHGSASISANTQDGAVKAALTGNWQGNPISGSISVALTPGNTFHAEVRAPRVTFNVSGGELALPYPLSHPSGFFGGSVTLQGRLTDVAKTIADVHFDELEIQPADTAPGVLLRNNGPADLHLENGIAYVRKLQFTTHAGQVAVTGQLGYASNHSMDLSAKGKVGLQAFELLDPNIAATGEGVIDARVQNAATNRYSDLEIGGSVAVHDGSFSMKGVPNELTHVNGSVQFDRHHASINELTGESGGGHIQLTGFLNFGQGPPSYDLRAKAKDVRVRYQGAMSVTADAALQLTGRTGNGLVSGDIQISRFVLASDADMTGLMSLLSARSATPAQPNDLFSGLRLNIDIQDTKDLQVVAAASRDIEADVDLRLRGTLDRPLLFGNITATQGSLRIFGAKYSINSGQIVFSNPARIEPNVNLDVQTVARGITVDITVSGTLNKLNLNYRSDPPLQPRDIIALLTVGQPPSFAPSSLNAQPTPNDVSALQAGANTVLGQAISPGSRRLSKLFGITNIKIDPLQQGITNTPQSRLTIEQQVSQSVTVTYVTNLVQTSEQIFRFEWALNPQYSIVAVRDDNGEFGIDIQYKKRFR